MQSRSRTRRLDADDLDRNFHALSDRTRREIVVTLARRQEASAGELGQRFDAAQPTISKHLRVLEEAGLVRRRIEGRNHWFSLEGRQLRDLDGWLQRHLKMWDDSLDRLAALLESGGELDG